MPEQPVTEQRYDIFFRGEALEGFAIETVKANVAQLFKASPEKTEQLFSGKVVPLRKDLDKATAAKFKQALDKAGAKIYIKLAAETAPAPATAAAAPAAVAPAARATPASPAPTPAAAPAPASAWPRYSTSRKSIPPLRHLLPGPATFQRRRSGLTSLKG